MAKILKSKEIWMSNFEQMNDPSEFKYSAYLITKILMKHNLLTADTDYSVGNLFYPDKGVLQGWPYIFSLAETPLSLPHWRWYADDAKGACIEFNTASLMNGYYPVLIKAIYNKERFEEIASSLLLITRKNEMYAECFLQDIKLLTSILKHECFEEEHEWRMVFPEAEENLTVKMIDNNGTIKRFLPFKFKKNAITNVYLGPANVEKEERIEFLCTMKEETRYNFNFECVNLPYKNAMTFQKEFDALRDKAQDMGNTGKDQDMGYTPCFH